MLDVTEADYDRIYNVNAKGAFFTLQQAARAVNSGGSIVYIGSRSTLRPSAAGFSVSRLEQAAGELSGRSARPGNRQTRNHGQRSHRGRDGRCRLLRRTQRRRPAPRPRAERQPARLAHGHGRRRRGTQSSSSPASWRAGSAERSY